MIIFYSRGFDLRLLLTLTNGILIWKPQKIFLTCEMWFLRSSIESKFISGQDQHVIVHGQCSFTWPLNLQKSWIPPFWSKYRLRGPLLTLTLPINELKVCSRFLRWLRFLKVSLESILVVKRYLTRFTPVVKFVYWQVTDNFADYYTWVVQHVYNNRLYTIGYIVTVNCL